MSKDQAILVDIMPKLQSFWEQHVLPEVLTRALENATPKEVTADTEIIYYYWGWKEIFVVGCNGVACPFEWIHLECIRPKRKSNIFIELKLIEISSDIELTSKFPTLC